MKRDSPPAWPKVAGANTYRDPVAGVRARVEQMRGEAAQREAQLSPSFFARLPEELADRLAILRDACAEVGDSLAELAAANRALADYCDALEEAIAQAPAMEAADRALPENVQDPKARTYTRVHWWNRRDAAELDDVVADLAGIIGKLDAAALVVEDGEFMRVLRFRAYDAPFALRMVLVDTNRPWIFELTLATSVPRAMPRLVLRPEGFAEGIVRSLGVRRPPDTGDQRFDGLFILETPAAERLLTHGLRAALIELAYFDIPTLEMQEGEATVTLRFDPTPACVNAAVRVMQRVRLVAMAEGKR